MTQFLAATGAIYLLASGTILTYGVVRIATRRATYDEDAIIRGLGIAGFFVWFFVGLGVIGWLLELPTTFLRWVG